MQITMRTFIQFFFSALALLLITDISFAQNVAEIGASKDNTLYENNTNDAVLSNGIGQHFFSGVNGTNERRRAVLYFDLTEIPAGSQIDNVELQLYMNRTGAGLHTIELYEILKDWGEGTSDGATGSGQGEGRGADATTGDATWVHTFYPNQNWDSPGGDYESTAVAALGVDGVGSYTWASTDELVALVQKWLDTPEDNHGLILVGDEQLSATAKRFSSRHNDTVEQRPLLVVDYTGEATSIDLISERPQSVQLYQNYPNPFNPSTTISFSVPEASFAEIAVYDLLGRRLETLISGRVQAGQHSVAFDASDLSSGLYMYTLQTASQRLTRRFTVVK